MTRSNIRRRSETVLACIAPLTSKELAVALGHCQLKVRQNLNKMCDAGRLQRVDLTPRQRRLTRGLGSAYVLVAR